MDIGECGQTGPNVAPPVEQVFNTALETVTILYPHIMVVTVPVKKANIRHALLAFAQGVL